MKIVKMKELAVSYKLKNAKKFKSTEQYLEYVIDEINKRANKYSFHQFLFLIDVLYVVLSDSRVNTTQSTQSTQSTQLIPLTPSAEITEHYRIQSEQPMSDAEMVRAFDEQEAKVQEAVNNTSDLKQKITTEKVNEESLFNHKLLWK